MSDSDDNLSRRAPHALARAGSSANMNGGGSSGYTGFEESHQVVVQFIKDVQPRAYKSKQKKHITAFARWYFSKKPQLHDRDIAYLLLGESDGSKKGLMESCGNSNIKKIGDIKKSSILALEMVVMLLDATINIHSEKFLEFLPNVPLKVIQSMKLDRHILSDTSEPDNAFKLLFMLQEQRPQTPIIQYLDGSQEAKKAYEDWYNDHMEELMDDELENEQDQGPRTWAEVKMEDLDREEQQGMEVDLELNGKGATGSSALASIGLGLGEDDDEQDMKDPLGLTKIQPKGRNGLDRDGLAFNKKKGVSSSKKMKLFWKKLLKQKEIAMAKMKLNNTNGMNSMAAGMKPIREADDEEEEEEEDEGSVQTHLIDTIIHTSHKGSIYTSQHDFNPILFLNTVHSQTSLSKLEQGLIYLERDLKDREVAMKHLVEQYFGNYIMCKDTIDHIHQLLQPEVTGSGGRSMKLLRDIESVRTECERLYAPLLERKVETDSIRQVLEILGRFKFLFSLPKKLKEKRGGWEQVIRDYQKAKQLVVLKANVTATTATAPTNAPSTTSAASASKSSANSSANANSASSSPLAPIIPTAANSVSLSSMMSSAGSAAAHSALAAGTLGIPESILLEIGTLVRSLRRELFTLLDNPTTPWSEQEKVISYLLALDCEQDPARYYLIQQSEAIGAQMEKALEELYGRLEASLNGTSLWTKVVASLNASSNNVAGSNLTSHSNGNHPIASPTSAILAPPLTSRLLHSSSSSLPVPISQLVLHTPETAGALAKFVRKLCHIFARALPEFVELATQIEGGKYGGWTPPQYGEPMAVTNAATSATATSSSASQQSLESSAPVGRRPSVFETNTSDKNPMGSPTNAAANANNNNANSIINNITSNEPPSVAKLIQRLNAQFVSYIRLTLFPTSTHYSNTVNTGVNSTPSNPSGVGGTPSKRVSVSGPTPSSLPSSATTNGAVPGATQDDRPFFSFPPFMYQHVHDILTCVEGIRNLRDLPLEHTTELKSMSEQLAAFYLEYHIRELLTNVAALAKDETWEVDPIRVQPSDTVSSGTDLDTFDSLLLASGGEDMHGYHTGHGGGSHGYGLGSSNDHQPLGHGHAGTSATNAPFQVTTTPAEFYYLLDDALDAFGAIPVIRTKWMVERMAGAVFEACKVYADGIHTLAMQLRASQEQSSHYDRMMAGVTGNSTGGGVGVGIGSGAIAAALTPALSSPVAAWTKPTDSDRRILLLWSNVEYSVESLLDPIFASLQQLMPDSTHMQLKERFEEDVIGLYQRVLDEQILLPTYIKNKVMYLNQIIKKGYFKSGINWRSQSSSATSAPTRVPLQTRSCILELLLQFVLIHDELYTVRKDELDRVMELIVEKVALTLLQTAREIEPVCDIFGANQFLLELELIESTLDYYLDDESSQCFDDAKNLLIERLDHAAFEFANSNGAGVRGTSKSANVKSSQFIENADRDRQQHRQVWKQNTATMWTCFQSIKIRKKKEADK